MNVYQTVYVLRLVYKYTCDVPVFTIIIFTCAKMWELESIKYKYMQ